MSDLPVEIFKAYDIRGVVGLALTPEVVELIGQAIGTEAVARSQTAIVIGCDGRLSSPALSTALAEGIRATGIHVIDIGLVTTPMAYFAAYQLGTRSAVMVTGSHNPPDHNGLKIVLDDETLCGGAIQALRRRIEVGDLSIRGWGDYRRHDITDEYIARVIGDVQLSRPMKILIDAGNGVAGAYAPALFRALGCEVEEMFCEVDGNFPNHHPDPSVPGNLAAMTARLKDGDTEIGLAFDGDGDRLGVVARKGEIIYPDRLLMLFADDVLSRNPDALIIFDVKSTRNLFKWISDRCGKPMLWKTGHSVIKAKMKETGALLAGEMSGHIFFKERWYGFDDGLYAGARLLESLSRKQDMDATLDALPDSACTPELHIPMGTDEAHQLIAKIRESAHFKGAIGVIDIDGLRVEYEDGFGLIRASNTISSIVLRFDADTALALARIQREIGDEIQRVAPWVGFQYRCFCNQ